MQLSKGKKKIYNSSGLTQTSAAANLPGLTEASNLHPFAHESRTRGVFGQYSSRWL